MPLQDCAQFQRQIKNWKDLPELILLVGEEESLMKDHLREINSQYLKLYGDFMVDFNTEKFHADTHEADRVLESCLTLPCGSTRKCVVLEHLEKYSPTSKSKIENYFENTSPSTTFILSWVTRLNSSIFNSPFVTKVSSKGIVSKYWRLFEEKRPQWIEAEVAKAEYRISTDASQLLSDEGGETLSELKNEIEKLKILCAQTKEISLQAVEESMSFKRSSSLWSFIDYLEVGKFKEAGHILEECLAQGEEPIKINYFIARHLRKSSSKISRSNLKNLFRELKKCDLLLKSGEDVESALFEQLLHSYSSSLSGF